MVNTRGKGRCGEVGKGKGRIRGDGRILDLGGVHKVVYTDDV